MVNLATRMRYLPEGKPVLNLTGRDATPQEIAAGVIEPSPEARRQIEEVLTMNVTGTYLAGCLAGDLTKIALREGATAALIEGPPFLAQKMEIRLQPQGILPVYALRRKDDKVVFVLGEAVDDLDRYEDRIASSKR